MMARPIINVYEKIRILLTTKFLTEKLQRKFDLKNKKCL